MFPKPSSCNTGSSCTLHPHLPNNGYYVSCCKSLIIINTLQVCPKNDSLLLDKMTPYHITRAHAPHRHCAVCSYRDNNTIISASMSRAYILMIVISARPVNCVCMSRKHIACMHYTYYWVGPVDRRGYGGQQKGTICDAHGLCPSICSSFSLISFDTLSLWVVQVSRSRFLCSQQK